MVHEVATIKVHAEVVSGVVFLFKARNCIPNMVYHDALKQPGLKHQGVNGPPASY